MVGRRRAERRETGGRKKKKGQAKVRMRQRDEEGELVQQCKIALAYSVQLPQQQARLISFTHICPGGGGGP